MPEGAESQAPLEDEIVNLDVTLSETLYEGRIQSFVRESFAYNGHDIAREFVRHPGAVVILAMDEDERVLVIKQYRHPVRAREWELPAGLLDVVNEPLLAAAQRELAEEADLVADRWSVLSDLRTSPGGSDEFVRVFLARGLSAAHEIFDREEEEADMELRWVSLEEIIEAIFEGRVSNALLVNGALAAFAARSRGWDSLRVADPLDV
jgi:8-oxo-dGTP pyrophosphatase MutT (NUDIX family)